ncbi:hypothetical protein M422DRAFT_132401, partial [Sphaerobolus stellatus SS14]
LFRTNSFRDRLVCSIVDEAHVIPLWGATGFRRDYADLKTVRVIIGSSVPWMGMSATMPTHLFEEIFKSLDMPNRPFWGIDMGSDRPNVQQHVRP